MRPLSCRRAPTRTSGASLVAAAVAVAAVAVQASACARSDALARVASRPAAAWQQEDFAGDFALRGTEPFWRGTIRGGAIVLRLASEARQRSYTSAHLTVNRGIATWTATRGPDTLVLTMRRAECGDGMGPSLYPLTVTLFGGVTGCGYPTWTARTGEPRPMPPFDDVRTASHRSDPLATCYVHPRRNVVVRTIDGEVGSHVFVRAPGDRRCDAVSLGGDFAWFNEREADYLLGLRGDILFLDSGTGPDERLLIVIDLRTRRQLVELAYSEVDTTREGSSVRVWRGHELDRPAPGCVVPPSLGAGIDSLFAVDLRTGRVGFAGRTRCGVRQ